MNYTETFTTKIGELASLVDILATAPVFQRADLRAQLALKYANFIDLETFFLYPELAAATVTTLKTQVAAIKTQMTAVAALATNDAGWGTAVGLLDTAMTTHFTSVSGTALTEAITRSGVDKLNRTQWFIIPDSVR